MSQHTPSRSPDKVELLEEQVALLTYVVERSEDTERQFRVTLRQRDERISALEKENGVLKFTNNSLLAKTEALKAARDSDQAAVSALETEVEKTRTQLTIAEADFKQYRQDAAWLELRAKMMDRFVGKWNAMGKESLTHVDPSESESFSHTTEHESKDTETEKSDDKGLYQGADPRAWNESHDMEALVARRAGAKMEAQEVMDVTRREPEKPKIGDASGGISTNQAVPSSRTYTRRRLLDFATR